MYEHAIISSFEKPTADLMRFRVGSLAVSEKDIEDCWKLVKIKFVDGFTRSIHYNLIYHTFLTRRMESMFRDVSPACSYCSTEENKIVNEDLWHIFIYCPATFNLYFEAKHILRKITGNKNETFALNDFLFGRRFPSRPKKELLFNIVIQIAQRVIISRKWAYHKGVTFDTLGTLYQLIYRTLNRAKLTLSLEAFKFWFSGDGGIVEQSQGKLCLTI